MPLNVQFVTVMPPPMRLIPPPLPAEFPLRVQPVSVTVAVELLMPPPLPPPLPSLAVLPLSVLLVSVKVPPLE